MKHRLAIGTAAVTLWGYLWTCPVLAQSQLQQCTATLSAARDQVAATTAGTKAFFAGGGYGGSSFSNVVDIYDSALGDPDDPNAWSTDALSSARQDPSATSVGDKAFFAGGYDGNWFAVVDIYDTAVPGWQHPPDALSLARSAMGETTVGTKAFFAGGGPGPPYLPTLSTSMIRPATNGSPTAFQKRDNGSRRPQLATKLSLPEGAPDS
jgi:hypothetical protein